MKFDNLMEGKFTDMSEIFLTNFMSTINSKLKVLTGGY